MPHPRPPPRPSPTGRTLRSRPRSRSPTTPTPWTTGTTGRPPPAAFCIYITFPCRAVAAGGRMAAESNKAAEFLSCGGKKWEEPKQRRKKTKTKNNPRSVVRGLSLCSSVLDKQNKKKSTQMDHTTTTTTTTTATRVDEAVLLLLLLSSFTCVRMFH